MAAPGRVLTLVLPLSLMVACTGGDAAKTGPAPTPTPERHPPVMTAPPVDEPPPLLEPDAEAGGEPVQPSGPADDGAAVDAQPVPDDERVMATKYGGPPAPGDAGVLEPTPVPETKPEAVDRPARKYGAPPRPARKYGAPPKPDPKGDPFG